MKISVVGTRGIPFIPGGVETHCQHLYPLVASKGHDVTVYRRDSYVQDDLTVWSGIKLQNIFSPRKKSIEAIVHTFIAIVHAKFSGTDVLHVHAVGPSLMVPLARLLGLRVVVTNHGPDYERNKWGKTAKFMLRLGEYMGCRFANEVIVISEHIRDIVNQRCKRDSHLIYNGVPVPDLTLDTDYIESLSLSPQRYMLALGRFVPEKGFHDLIDAFELMGGGGKLVIAGDSDHEDNYSLSLKDSASQNPDIVMPGYVTGDHLVQLLSHARLFVMPSYHEGLPIALLEALSYGLPVVVSDIPAHVEVNLESNAYFTKGNVSDLCDKMAQALARPIDQTYIVDMRNQIQSKYNWDTIASKTVAVYQKAIK